MKCPKCSYEMVEGKTFIAGGFPNFLLTGSLAFANLTFKAAAWKDHVVQDTSDVWPAHYCDKCGAVAIETTRCGLSTLES